jgi:O-succinylbenzoic acid--CoA ligase
VWLLSLMPAHIGGLSIIVRAAVAGCAVVIPPDLKRPLLHQISHEHAVTHLSLVPSVAEEFIKIGPIPESLQALLLGGERITTAQRRALASLPECYLSYGATETASCIAVARLAEIWDIPDSVGFPISDTNIQIRDERGELCSTNEPGIVEISGPTISGEKYDSHSGHQIWRSTDRGYIDNSGMLHILGRTDEVIISGGVKISANEIVDAAIATNLVTEAAVIKSPDNQWGEKAILFATAPTTTSAKTLYEELRKSLGAPRAPREIIILFSFPRTAIGKIDRSELKLYGADLTLKDGTFSPLIRQKFLR